MRNFLYLIGSEVLFLVGSLVLAPSWVVDNALLLSIVAFALLGIGFISDTSIFSGAAMRKQQDKKLREEEIEAARRWRALAVDIQETIDDFSSSRVRGHAEDPFAAWQVNHDLDRKLVERLNSKYGERVIQARQETWAFTRDLAASSYLAGHTVNLLMWRSIRETLVSKALEVEQENFKRYQKFKGEVYEGSLLR